MYNTLLASDSECTTVTHWIGKIETFNRCYGVTRAELFYMLQIDHVKAFHTVYTSSYSVLKLSLFNILKKFTGLSC